MSFVPLARKSNFDTGGAAILVLSILMYSLVREYLVRASGNDTAPRAKETPPRGNDNLLPGPREERRL